MSLSTINGRLDLVEEMLEYPQLRQDVMTLLRRTFDTLRLVTKFTLGRGDADDLVELSKTISDLGTTQSRFYQYQHTRVARESKQR